MNIIFALQVTTFKSYKKKRTNPRSSPRTISIVMILKDLLQPKLSQAELCRVTIESEQKKLADLSDEEKKTLQESDK